MFFNQAVLCHLYEPGQDSNSLVGKPLHNNKQAVLCHLYEPGQDANSLVGKPLHNNKQAVLCHLYEPGQDANSLVGKPLFNNKQKYTWIFATKHNVWTDEHCCVLVSDTASSNNKTNHDMRGK